uniref:Histocompatibility minor 13 n=1 Tax=Ficedula albicollis TaxID=59894 RepID=A0A803VQE1_FICAL
MPETITSRDAARFPIVASCTLLGLYLFFKIFSQEYINLLLSMYFFVLGILALSHTISPMMNRFFPANFPNKQYQLLFTQGSGESKEEIVNYEFDTKDLVCLALSSVVGVWYLLRKHWIANNLFGLAFSLNGVELLHLNNVSTGCILLGGLFIYDVFWVFGTNVMVTVAKSFEAPIKLVFPQDLLEKGLDADNFAMLGLGDIVIPACAAVPGPRLHWIPASRGLGKGRSNRNVQVSLSWRWSCFAGGAGAHEACRCSHARAQLEGRVHLGMLWVCAGTCVGGSMFVHAGPGSSPSRELGGSCAVLPAGSTWCCFTPQ